MEEKVKISMLIETYGKLLTEKQNQILNDYYNNDLSLSEIAENEGITRQAVRDIIKKGEKTRFFSAVFVSLVLHLLYPCCILWLAGCVALLEACCL